VGEFSGSRIADGRFSFSDGVPSWLVSWDSDGKDSSGSERSVEPERTPFSDLGENPNPFSVIRDNASSGLGSLTGEGGVSGEGSRGVASS